MAIDFNHVPQPVDGLSLVQAPVAESDRGITFRHKVAAATVSALGPADMALSDGIFAKTYGAIEKHLSPFQDALLNRITQAGALSAVVFGESFLVGMLVAKNRTIQGSFEAFDDYSQKAQAEMSLGRRAVTAVMKSPLYAIGWVGDKIEKGGEKISSSGLPQAEKVGALVADIGNTNALGTTTVIMNESMHSEAPVTTRRVGRLAAVITGSWLATAETIRQVYRGIGKLGQPGEAIQNGIGAFARTLDTLTTVGLNPAETPIGSLFMGSVVGSLAVTGWKIAEMQQQNASQPNLDHISGLGTE